MLNTTLNTLRLTAYWMAVAVIFTVLLTVEIIKCFLPLAAVVINQVERTIEWYILPTVTPNWHTEFLIGSLTAGYLQLARFARSVVAYKLLRVALSPSLNLSAVSNEWDTDRRFSL